MFKEKLKRTVENNIINNELLPALYQLEKLLELQELEDYERNKAIEIFVYLCKKIAFDNKFIIVEPMPPLVEFDENINQISYFYQVTDNQLDNLNKQSYDCYIKAFRAPNEPSLIPPLAKLANIFNQYKLFPQRKDNLKLENIPELPKANIKATSNFEVSHAADVAFGFLKLIESKDSIYFLLEKLFPNFDKTSIPFEPYVLGCLHFAASYSFFRFSPLYKSFHSNDKIAKAVFVSGVFITREIINSYSKDLPHKIFMKLILTTAENLVFKEVYNIQTLFFTSVVSTVFYSANYLFNHVKYSGLDENLNTLASVSLISSYKEIISENIPFTQKFIFLGCVNDLIGIAYMTCEYGINKLMDLFE